MGKVRSIKEDAVGNLIWRDTETTSNGDLGKVAMSGGVEDSDHGSADVDTLVLLYCLEQGLYDVGPGH